MGVLAAKNKILTFSDEGMIGGQIFAGFPVSDAAVAQAWSEVWFEEVMDLIAPAVATPPGPMASKAAFEGAMVGLVSTPNGGLAALAAGVTAGFPALALAIVPNLIAAPPPAPFLPVLTAAMTPFLTGGTDPVAPAQAFADAVKTWLTTAMWTVPPAPAPVPLPFTVAP